jgi:thiamine biosynthesis protein ThiS
MRVIANGAPVEMAEGATLVDLIEAIDLTKRFVVLEHNGETVPRRDLAGTILHDGDVVDVVKAIAGG